MYSVYVLYSKTFDKIYVGFTSDLNARFISHNERATKGYTIRYRPWVILHSERYQTKAEALKREKQLKSAKGREYIWRLVANYNLQA